MPISLKRVYEEPSPDDGARILVDRLWPRGVSKEKARVDLWAREIAPSDELRTWYGHDPEKWEEFRRRYFAELGDAEDALEPVLEKVAKGPVTFVYSSRETELNNAVALREYVEERL